MTQQAVSLVVVAAGSGRRLGADGPKALVGLAGRPLLAWVLELLARSCAECVVVAPPTHLQAAQQIALQTGAAATVVAGGETRSASVAAGLAASDAALPLVAVHDAARPLVGAETLAACLAVMAEGADAAAPALSLADTIKRVDPADPGRVVATVDRSQLRAVQTPQVFRRPWLERAHAPGAEATDDLALVERLGGVVRLAPGHVRNLKITYPDDLALAAAMVAADPL